MHEKAKPNPRLFQPVAQEIYGGAGAAGVNIAHGRLAGSAGRSNVICCVAGAAGGPNTTP